MPSSTAHWPGLPWCGSAFSALRFSHSSRWRKFCLCRGPTPGRGESTRADCISSGWKRSTAEDVWRFCRRRNTSAFVKTVAVRLPEELVAQIEAESRDRRMSKSDVIRERLSSTLSPRRRGRLLDVIQEVTGLLDGLPADLSARKKHYRKTRGYGQKRSR